MIRPVIEIERDGLGMLPHQLYCTGVRGHTVGRENEWQSRVFLGKEGKSDSTQAEGTCEMGRERAKERWGGQRCISFSSVLLNRYDPQGTRGIKVEVKDLYLTESNLTTICLTAIRETQDLYLNSLSHFHL